MKAKIIGVKKVDFNSNDGPVKLTQFFVNHKEDNVEGLVSNVVTHNDMRNGPPPVCKIGEEYEVEYNKYGKLRFA